ncbi:protein GVQW3-like [Octopus bimaculoides]|uniref:protein GVQW3-like n=1 Tax=Octopus bimaculoides TaxID=37653 RepID=UPI00071C89DE|nr:protein GVQW3-like [Octopus bimaculoides]|eukprot:XP_014768137.1 PREDICTED: putative uncharacterized protein FLJ37770 [Octopus bimaculoides]
MKEVYGDDAQSCNIVKYWHYQFKCGRTSVETAPIHGRQHSATDDNTIHKIEAAILDDRRITIRTLPQEVKTSVGSVENIIHDHLQMRKLSARWIPRMLIHFQKQERVNYSQALLATCQESKEDFFGRLFMEPSL